MASEDVIVVAGTEGLIAETAPFGGQPTSLLAGLHASRDRDPMLVSMRKQ